MAAENEKAQDEPVKFKIEGVEYELPGVDDLDLDEWELMYERTGILFEDFAPLENKKDETARSRRLSQPGFLRTMLEISMRRTYPDRDHDAIADVVRKAKMLPVLESISEGKDADALPPESTLEPVPSSPRNSDDSSESESSDSPTTSDDQGDLPEAIGT